MIDYDKVLAKPIIFVGPGRSGSTIISEFVLSHNQLGWPDNYLEWMPSVASTAWLTRLSQNRLWRVGGEKGQLNKTKFMNNYIPRPAEAWSFWQSITREDIDFSRGFLLQQRASSSEKNKIRRTLAKRVSRQGKQRLAMKFTGPARAEYLHSIFPDALFVNVVRDPTATVNSLLNVPFWQSQGRHELWWHGAYSSAEQRQFNAIKDDGIASTAFQLSKVLESNERELSKFSNQVLTVNYEDFVANPRAVTNRILAFCQLPNCEVVDAKVHNCRVRDQNKNSEKLTSIREQVLRYCGSN